MLGAALGFVHAWHALALEPLSFPSESLCNFKACARDQWKTHRIIPGLQGLLYKEGRDTVSSRTAAWRAARIHLRKTDLHGEGRGKSTW